MDTLYHYCTTQAFHSIVENRAIWLSSLKLSNDTTEGTLVLDALTHLAKRDNLDSAAISRVQEAVVHLQDEVDGLGLCLSENGDLLSQWRSPYADDGTGVAVGFSRAYLQSLAASFYEYGWSFGKVVYTDTDTDTDTEHDAELESTYDQIKRLIEAGAYQGKSDFGLEDEKLSDALHSLVARFFLLKSTAFREEREWRLLSLIWKTRSQERKYRPALGRIVPYRTVELKSLNQQPLIELVLGPRHETPTYVARDFLAMHDFGELPVRRSIVPYRSVK